MDADQKREINYKPLDEEEAEEQYRKKDEQNLKKVILDYNRRNMVDTEATRTNGRISRRKLLILFRAAAERAKLVLYYLKRNRGRFYKLLQPIIKSQLIQYRREAKDCKKLMEQ